MFKSGDHVWADFGDVAQGGVIAHVLGGEKDGKHSIQHPDGSVRPMTYREPADRDEKGSGGTFWSL